MLVFSIPSVGLSIGMGFSCMGIGIGRTDRLMQGAVGYSCGFQKGLDASAFVIPTTGGSTVVDVEIESCDECE